MSGGGSSSGKESRIKYFEVTLTDKTCSKCPFAEETPYEPLQRRLRGDALIRWQCSHTAGITGMVFCLASGIGWSYEQASM